MLFLNKRHALRPNTEQKYNSLMCEAFGPLKAFCEDIGGGNLIHLPDLKRVAVHTLDSRIESERYAGSAAHFIMIRWHLSMEQPTHC